jgi:endonuclease YncB( thermonuclease family)
MRGRIAALAALAATLSTGFALGPAPAFATTWTAKVVQVADGDTFTADVDGDGQGPVSIRMAGIDAMETGQCNAAAAKSLLERYIGGRRVRLIATHSAPLAARGRYLRFVETLYDMPERYKRDVGAVVLDGGLAVPYPSNIEPARNSKYKTIAIDAQERAVRIWDEGPLTTNGEPSGSDRCGAGPRQDVPIRLVLRWDADGNDETNMNDEWVRIHNDGDVPLGMDGWVLRDSAHTRFVFRQLAPGTVIQPHDWIKVHSGHGTQSARQLYWRRGHSVFGNATLSGGRIMGDGAYLVDRDNDVRAFTEYPCVSGCRDPIGQSIDLSANYDGYGNDDEDPNREWINIRNRGAAPIDLQGYVVINWPYTYEFTQQAVVQPDERLRLYVGQGVDGALTRYWGRAPHLDKSDSRTTKGSILAPDDAVILGTYTGKTAVEFDWPAPDCPAVSTNYARQACPNPDVVIASVNPGDDSLVLRNDTGADVDLLDWDIQSWGEYSFDDHYVLGPAQTVEIRPGDPGTDGGGVLHSTDLRLPGGSGLVRLYTRFHAVAHCKRWGDRSC